LCWTETNEFIAIFQFYNTTGCPQKKKKEWMMMMMMMISVRSVIYMHVRQFSSPKSDSRRTACTDDTEILA
jgi:hypothetical protein